MRAQASSAPKNHRRASHRQPESRHQQRVSKDETKDVEELATPRGQYMEAYLLVLAGDWLWWQTTGQFIVPGLIGNMIGGTRYAQVMSEI